MRIILTTLPLADAPQLARTLLEEQMIACCNILPQVSSMYWWKGELMTDTESLLLIKTREDLVPALIVRIKELHPYDVPEVVVIPVETGFEGYLSWVRETCRPTLED